MQQKLSKSVNIWMSGGGEMAGHRPWGDTRDRAMSLVEGTGEEKFIK